MRIGIFCKTFARESLSECLDAVVAHGLGCIQFNMSCVGLPGLPERIEPELCDAIRRETSRRNLIMAAVSGTFNMIHPDLSKRTEGMRRLQVLAQSCRQLGTRVITLCTGTRDRENMWRHHPLNESQEAWEDLRTATREALKIAEEFDVTLGIEPEVANVVNSAAAARRLLDEIKSSRLKIVIDPANLFPRGQLPRMRVILNEAFHLLGNDLVLAHAKDLSHDGEAGHEAAGTGRLDYDHYLSLLESVKFDGPLILHGLREDQVAHSVQFLCKKMQARRQETKS